MSKGKPQQRKRARSGAIKQSAKKPLWRKPVVWLGGAATTVATGVLTSLLVNVLSAQSQQVIAQPSSAPAAPTSMQSHVPRTNPRRITSPSASRSSGPPLTVVSEDPINPEDNGGEWVFPGKVVLTQSELKTLNTSVSGMPIVGPSYMNLLFSLGAYQVHPDTQLVVQNNQAQAIRILNINVVKSCQAPLTGTLIYSPSGGADPSIELGFNLDSVDTEAETASAAQQLSLSERQPFAGVGLVSEGLRSRAQQAIWSPVTSLPPARWQLADAAEAPCLTAWHQAALRLRRCAHAVTGSTVPASMNSRSADSGMRTKRPTRVNRIRRSATSRRVNRGLVPSAAAASSRVRSRSIPGFMGAIAPPSVGWFAVKSRLTLERQ
jgi:hypothetical protein